MSKIIVEDHTKPLSVEEKVESLASSLYLTAAQSGMMIGLNTKEIVEAALAGAEHIVSYFSMLNRITNGEVTAARLKAQETAAEKIKQMQDNGTLDAVRKLEQDNQK